MGESTQDYRALTLMFFNPTGTLNIAADPSDIDEGGLTRAKNINSTRTGIIKTRAGSVKINSSSIGVNNHIRAQSGNRYSFSTSIYNNEISIGSGYASGQWSSVSYNAFNETTEQIFALNGTDLVRISGDYIYNWGIAQPTTAPEAYKNDALTAISGTYSIQYTYARKNSGSLINESSPSPASNSVSIDAGIQAYIPWPTDSQITHVRAYRTTSNGSIYYLDDDTAVTPRTTEDGEVYTFDWEKTQGYTSSTYKWTTTDSDNSTEYCHEFELDLGTATVSFMRTHHIWEGIRYASNLSDSLLGAQITEDNDAPPAGTYLAGPNYGGTLFIIKDNLLYYSKPRRPENWPALYFIEVSTAEFPGKTITFYNGQPYYFTKRHIFYIQGTGHNTFQPLNMRARTGAQGPMGAYTVDGHGIYHTGPDGLYLFSGGNDRKVTKDTLDPIFLGESVKGIPACDDNLVSAWVIAYKSRIYFGYRSSGTYPSNVFVMDMDEPRKTVYYSYDFEIADVEVDESNGLLLALCGDGFVRKLEFGTQDDSVDISWEIQSKDFTLQTRRHFPRWAKYDVDGSATGEIILDDVSHQSHSITGSRDTTRRLIEVGNGNRCAIKLSGSGASTVYGVEFE